MADARPGIWLTAGRLSLFILAFLAAEFLGQSTILPILASATVSGSAMLPYAWVDLGAVLAATAICLAFDARRTGGTSRWESLGLAASAARPRVLLSAGAIGALAIGVPSLVLLATGLLEVTPGHPSGWGSSVTRALALLVPAACTEELLTRGYALRVLADGFTPAVAVATTSVVFGLLHLANPGANALSIAMVILAGVFLGTVRLATKSLYAAIAAHLAWNLTMVLALHSAVSGLGISMPDYAIVDSGPDWLTGGTWGPEGGVAAGLGMIVAIRYLFARHLRRQETQG